MVTQGGKNGHYAELSSMESRKFNSGSILDKPPLVSDSAPVNALVPIPGGAVGKPKPSGDPAYDFIEGEFEAEGNTDGHISGFFCRKCKAVLFVGDKVCAGCEWVFRLPTPSLHIVETKFIPEFRSYFYYERTTAEEMKRSAERKEKHHPAISLSAICSKIFVR